MATTEVKWIGVGAFVDAARLRLGESAWGELVAKLPPPTRELLATVSAQLGAIQAGLEVSGLSGVRVSVVQNIEHGVRARASWS
jgi:hypothetical protein